MSVKIYHIPRDYSKSLEAQKKELENKYKNGWQYLWTDSSTGNAKIHFFAEEIGESKKI